MCFLFLKTPSSLATFCPLLLKLYKNLLFGYYTNNCFKGYIATIEFQNRHCCSLIFTLHLVLLPSRGAFWLPQETLVLAKDVSLGQRYNSVVQ